MEIVEKVAALLDPGTYPERPARIEAVETHISWVFLAEDAVYKLKKAVRHAYLDFRTLDMRHRDCLEEVRLNRRLAPDVYLGVVALRVDTAGRLRLGGAGRTLDWLVHMRRLPSPQMLDQRLAVGGLREQEVLALGRFLGRFYAGLSPVEVLAEEYRRVLDDEIGEILHELSGTGSGLPVAQVRDLCRRQREFIRCHGVLLDQRVEAGRLVEGHGDLRPEHICLADPPAIIDCLEFRRAFRILDAADELGFLALECERLGADWIAQPLFSGYRKATGDRPLTALVHFYQSFRAMLRAKIAIWHNRDHEAREPDKWVRRAKHYLALAGPHIDHAGTAAPEVSRGFNTRAKS